LQTRCKPLSLPFGRSLNVCFGSLADIAARSRTVRFTPDSGHSSVEVGYPKSAIVDKAAASRRVVGSGNQAAGSSSEGIVVFRLVDARGDGPHGHEFRRVADRGDLALRLANVRKRPSAGSAACDRGLRDPLVRRHSDDCHRANPLAALRVTSHRPPMANCAWSFIATAKG
jgi:hypothetical protein